MDGVLFDSEPLHISFEQLLFERLNIKLSEKQKNTLIGLGDYKVWAMLKESFNLTESLEQLLINDRRERISYFMNNEVIIMPGAKKLLERLNKNGLRLALASSSQMDLIDLNLERAGFKHFFEVVVSNDMVASGKPDPDIFLYAAERLKVSPQNCLVIEDSENGVKAAKSAGMRCIAFTNNSLFNQNISKADIAVNNLLDITHKLILTLNS
jgi:HAD superfamily hydrolase (TIGR01509 family)